MKFLVNWKHLINSYIINFIINLNKNMDKSNNYEKVDNIIIFKNKNKINRIYNNLNDRTI
jgi:hypothetical protein